MLLSLHVKDLAIIDEVEVNFTDKLNILSGETGAGKSIIIGSINIALGAKVPKSIIRSGADYALIELVFGIDDEDTKKELEKMDISVEDDAIIISRKITSYGRIINKINGEMVATTQLKKIAGIIIDIHGQHENQSLLTKRKHLDVLDRFAKDSIGKLKDDLKGVYKNYSNIKKELDEVSIDEETKNREISLLEYEINEIESAKLVEKEDEELEIEYRKLSNSQNIISGLSEAYNYTASLNDSATENVSRAVKALSGVVEYDDSLSGCLEQIIDIENLLNDFNKEVSGYISDCEDSSEQLQETGDRLDLINRLKAKYGSSIEEILAYCNANKEKLEKMRNYDEYVQSLKDNLQVKEKELEDLSSRLSDIRKKMASRLVERIKEALTDLNFIDVKFEMEFKKMDKYTDNGYDDAEFVISTNPGEELRPLKNVASGGELSRIMLALKSVLADSDSIDTLIFDEIDAGISGRTAQKVSEKLLTISRSRQVICITHLPQIASMADTHFIIEKMSDSVTTHTDIRKLKEEEIINELARLLGGVKITDSVIESAKEMKKLANEMKYIKERPVNV